MDGKDWRIVYFRIVKFAFICYAFVRYWKWFDKDQNVYRLHVLDFDEF